MQKSVWQTVIACVVVWYGASAFAPTGGEPGDTGTGLQIKQERFRIQTDGAAADVYRRTKHQVEGILQARLGDPWETGWHLDRAVEEVRECAARVQARESGGLERGGGAARADRMFASWKRLRMDGQEAALETEAAKGERGGPEEEVVIGTGEVVLEETDAALPSREGVGFTLVRTYRSQLDYDGPLGPGWDHSYNQRIVLRTLQPGGQELVWYTGKNAIRFRHTGQDWDPEPGAWFRLRREGTGIIVETGQGMRLVFEPARPPQTWRLAAIAGRHDQWQANVMKFHYWPGSDLLSEVEDPYGNRIQFFYDPAGRLSSVQCRHFVVRYTYDAQGLLRQVSVPRVAVDVDRTEDIVWEHRSTPLVPGERLGAVRL